MGQENQILNYLQKGKKLTPIKALNMFGCFRLGARIYDLRRQGYQIDSKIKKLKSGKYVAEYSLRSDRDGI